MSFNQLQFSSSAFNTGTVTFIIQDGEITNFNASTKNLIIPSTINGITVTSIGEAAFKSKELESVEMPNSVAVIKDEAFADNNLDTIVIHANVNTVATKAYANNPNLKTVIVLNPNVTIGTLAFGLDED